MKKPFVPYVDAQRMHRLHPATFQAPSANELSNIRVGDHVKICTGEERFWVELKVVTNEKLIGNVDNELVHTNIHGLVLGDTIQFERRHIFDIL